MEDMSKLVANIWDLNSVLVSSCRLYQWTCTSETPSQAFPVFEQCAQ